MLNRLYEIEGGVVHLEGHHVKVEVPGAVGHEGPDGLDALGQLLAGDDCPVVTLS